MYGALSFPTSNNSSKRVNLCNNDDSVMTHRAFTFSYAKMLSVVGRGEFSYNLLTLSWAYCHNQEPFDFVPKRFCWSIDYFIMRTSFAK